jgi:serine/threonine-protein kinase RsbW
MQQKTIVIPSSHSQICCVCNTILSDVKSRHFSDDDIFGIHLAVEEAIINAVKHGNNGDESKNVRINYFVTDEKFDIEIVDEGVGFTPKDVPDPRQGNNVFKASGRGLLLMKAYMDSVEYNVHGNCVHMVKIKK